MKKIGIISDTHGNLPSEIFEIFDDVDEIWHAGDVGNLNLIYDLETIAPVECVQGNVDGFPICYKYPEQKIINIGNLRFLLIHRFFDQSGRIFPSMKDHLKGNFDAIIYGHTHTPNLQNGHDNTLFFNPGSPCFPRNSKPSVGLLTIDDAGNLKFQLHFLAK